MKCKIKGRVMWSCPRYSPDIKEKKSALWGHSACVPVLVLPLDDMDGLVEQITAVCEKATDQWLVEFAAKGSESETAYFQQARAVLSSLGVRFPKQKKAKS